MTIATAKPPGWPGIAPTWSSSAKDAVGTSPASSRVWFTIGRGILNEVYWPRVDRPQIRDLGFIVADDQGFWSEVKREADQEVSYPAPGVPAIVVIHRHPCYSLRLRVCTDNFADVVRIEATLEDRRDAGDPKQQAHPLRLYPLLAPHLGLSGHSNRAWVGSYKGRPILYAQHEEAVLALASEPPATRMSVGYVGVSDGWQDFAANARMTWAYPATDKGNIAGMTELMLADGVGNLALGFGVRPEEAALEASAALATPFQSAWDDYVASWVEFLGTTNRAPAELLPFEQDLYVTSAAVLRTHQDGTEPGATVASLSIPWGNATNDRGGYHLVWTRDLVEVAGAFVALGAQRSARRTLAYLVATQEPDGHWFQNQWLDGVAYWGGVQLDEAAYPILLVGALRRSGAWEMHGKANEAAAFAALLAPDALDHMVRAAAGFLARTGPVTAQDRWEETSGLTASTLAPVVAALVVAADYLPEPAATYCRELADDWNASIETWTFAIGGPLAKAHGVDGYYVRIAAPEVLLGAPMSSPVVLNNRPLNESLVPADQVVGTDFLALVRFGLRQPNDERILASLQIADALLRSETPSGPVWHRYTGDGYGEHEDGRPYDGTGVGRGWPLLVGERGHYELAAGRDALPFLGAMWRMSSAGGMLPEQVWDTDDMPDMGLARGRPTGAAMPLAWAHAEYIKLARSMALGHPIDRPEAAWDRYHGIAPVPTRAIWRFDAPIASMPSGRILRIEVMAPARVRISLDASQTWFDFDMRDTTLGIWLVDVEGSDALSADASIAFTFWWPDAGRWEEQDFQVMVKG